MKIDLNLEPKDYIKLLVLLGAGGMTAILSGGKDTESRSERLAVLETKVEQIRTDVSEIKSMVRHRR